MITCSLNDRIFSAGLVLKCVSNLKHVQDIRYFILEFIAFFGNIALLNVPTIAVVKGAAIAGGSMVAFAHDLGKPLLSCKEKMVKTQEVQLAIGHLKDQAHLTEAA